MDCRSLLLILKEWRILKFSAAEKTFKDIVKENSFLYQIHFFHAPKPHRHIGLGAFFVCFTLACSNALCRFIEH